MKITVLLVNLGTPDTSSTKDVRKYLTEFLNDERVIDINSIGRSLLVNGIIVPFRAPKSAALYKKIFTERGSPLMFYGVELQQKLQQILGENYIVEFAMRYQNPSLESVLNRIQRNQTSKLVIIPLYPQYASSSTGSTIQKIFSIVSHWLTIPSISVTHQFFDNENFINCFVANGKKMQPEKYDHVLFSFHGLPERQIRKSDCYNVCLKDNCCAKIDSKNYSCYRAASYETARQIARKLNLEEKNFTVSFQSRLGRTPWIKPYSDEVIKELAEKGVKRMLVFSPSFVADCLETIYEIGEEYNVLFQKHSGEKIDLVPSLNSNDDWVETLKLMIENK